ncbi:MAG: hypothetical protein HY720_13900 [Planctomycetes bacterium]|nr:hypothetical protein [Planctomycetota bacterium]
MTPGDLRRTTPTAHTGEVRPGTGHHAGEDLANLVARDRRQLDERPAAGWVTHRALARNVA